ncbi:MAG: S-methyl-5'-thioinosine phosphorylase [Chromatocurvus sp.]
MKRLAILGGTGVDQLQGFTPESHHTVDTPFGAVSAAIESGRVNGMDVAFLQRHGQPRSLPPHRINYQANIWALQHIGITHVVALNAVGGIGPGLTPGTLVIPDQIIDYTSGRAHTFNEGGDSPPQHVDFSEPYSAHLRQALLRACAEAGERATRGGVMAVTQGPRLETAAEVRRLQRDGCDVVGMTGMPEASLARELGLHYASLSMVVNAAAGLGDAPITLEAIMAHLNTAAAASARVISALVTDAYFSDGVPVGG